MARPKLTSGPHQVANAELLFRQSVARGKADFRYVALAIGAEPFQPPRWAVWECILEKDRVARRAPSGTKDVSVIMDEVVRFFAREQALREDHPERRTKRLPSLQQAVRSACDALGVRARGVEGPKADTSWMKDVERAWKREQDEDVVESHHRLLHFKTTKRISDIVEGLVAQECGHPPDLQQYLWMAREIDGGADQDI